MYQTPGFQHAAGLLTGYSGIVMDVWKIVIHGIPHGTSTHACDICRILEPSRRRAIHRASYLPGRIPGRTYYVHTSLATLLQL